MTDEQEEALLNIQEVQKLRRTLALIDSIDYQRLRALMTDQTAEELSHVQPTTPEENRAVHTATINALEDAKTKLDEINAYLEHADEEQT